MAKQVAFAALRSFRVVTCFVCFWGCHVTSTVRLVISRKLLLFLLTPKTSSYFSVVGDSLKSAHMEGEDPDESFASQHGEVAGRTREIRSGPTARRKREAYIRHRVAAGEVRAEVAGAHSGGQSRPLGISMNWEPNPDSSSEDSVEIIERLQPRIFFFFELGPITLVPQSALYQPVRAVIPNKHLDHLTLIVRVTRLFLHHFLLPLGPGPRRCQRHHHLLWLTLRRRRRVILQVLGPTVAPGVPLSRTPTGHRPVWFPSVASH